MLYQLLDWRDHSINSWFLLEVIGDAEEHALVFGLLKIDDRTIVLNNVRNCDVRIAKNVISIGDKNLRHCDLLELITR
jgi:hypothetical protein